MALDQTFRFAERVAKARKPVDGDGDGFVYDGTPRKRPATPAERAAGARLRAQQGGKAPAAPKPAKKAAAKNDYDKRVDKFDRAINQAIRAKDPKKVKEVHNLIGQDFVLKKPDRDDLQAVLAARRDGLPDPAPVKGSNREKRGVAGAPAAAPAKKIAAPKAPAKKAPAPPAKKAVAEKPATPLHEKVKRPGAIKRAAAKKPEVNPPKRKTGPVTRAHRALNEAVANNEPGVKQKTDFGNLPTGPETKAYEALDAAKSVAELDAAMDQALEDRRAGRLAPDKYRQIEAEWKRRKAAMGGRSATLRTGHPNKVVQDAQRAKNPLGPRSTHGQKTNAWKRLIQRDLGNARNLNDIDAVRRQINAMKRKGRISESEYAGLHDAANARMREINGGGGGPKGVSSIRRRMGGLRERVLRGGQTDSDKAMMQRVQALESDIRGAQNVEQMDRIKAAIRPDMKDWFRKPENKVLMDRVNAGFRERKKELVAGQAAAPAPKGREERLKEADQKIAAIHAARGAAAKDRAAQDLLNWVDQDSGLDYKDRMAVIDHAQDVHGGVAAPRPLGERAAPPPRRARQPKPETVRPPAKPGQARAKAKAKMPPAPPTNAKGSEVVDHYNERMSLAYDPNELGLHLIEVNKAWERGQVSDEDFSRFFERYNIEEARVKRIQQQAPGNASQDEGDMTQEAFDALRAHFDAGGSLADAPEAGLWNYMRAHPDRFAIKSNSNAKQARAVSENYWVDDKQTGERWMAKHHELLNDVQRENMAAAIMKGAGHRYQDTKYASHRNNTNDGVLLQRHLGEALAGDRKAFLSPNEFGGLRNAGFRGARLDKGKDPGAAARMLVFDYLIDNRIDRHGNNVGAIKHPDGAHDIVIFDQGLCFGGFQRASQDDARLDFPGFYRGYRATQWDIARAIGAAANFNAADVEDDLRDALDGFNKVDINILRAQYDSVDDDELRRQMELWVNIFERRRKWLNDNFDSVVRHMVAAGGAR